MEWIVESESLSDFVDHGWYTISSKPLVRCKDCKHYTDEQAKGSEYSYCLKIDAWMKPEDYCSYGERKERSMNE